VQNIATQWHRTQKTENSYQCFFIDKKLLFFVIFTNLA